MTQAMVTYIFNRNTKKAETDLCESKTTLLIFFIFSFLFLFINFF